MATAIRLKRQGAKKAASYRIIVTDSREGTSGAAIERLGLYNPRTRPSLVRIDAARTLHWLHEGAKPSDTVRSLLRKTGVWQQFHDGVDPASLETAVVEIGPPPGQRGTSQRPMPEAEPEPQPDPEPAPEPEAKAEPEAEAAPEPPTDGEPAAAEATAEDGDEAADDGDEAADDGDEAADDGDEAAAGDASADDKDD